jgi:hypothetical protein
MARLPPNCIAEPFIADPIQRLGEGRTHLVMLSAGRMQFQRQLQRGGSL